MKWFVVLLAAAFTLAGVCEARNQRDIKAIERDLNRDEGDTDVLASLRTLGSDKAWLKKHWIPLTIGGALLALLILIVLVLLVVLCTCIYKRKKRSNRQQPLGSSSQSYGTVTTSAVVVQSREPGVNEAFNNQKREKERREKEIATEAMMYFQRNHTNYKVVGELGELGSRMQKYWFKVTDTNDKRHRELLLTTTPVSQKCPIKFDNAMHKGVNKLLKELQKHPNLQPIEMMEYMAAHTQVVIVQPYYHEGGSLKDTIYRASPSTDWSNKYSRRSKGLPVEKVQKFGWQILEAVHFLYDKGFPMIGHIHSGNCFVVNNECRLGGYENTILGYKTRHYRLCKEFANDKLDVIMFGHLVFEMSCGYELTELYPGDSEYKTVKDDEIKEVLHYIFEEGFPHTLTDVKSLNFFSVIQKELETFDVNLIKISDSMEKVLQKVRKGKPRQQIKPSKHKATPPPTSSLPPEAAGGAQVLSSTTTPLPKTDSRSGKKSKKELTPLPQVEYKPSSEQTTPTGPNADDHRSSDTVKDKDKEKKKKTRLAFPKLHKKKKGVATHTAEEVEEDKEPLM